MIADADRIRELEEQLGEMGAGRDRFDRLARSHEAAHERTKAELAEAIEQRDIARAEWQGADCKADAMRTERDEANAERDAAIGNLVIAQADAAALRLAVDGSD